MKRPTVRKFYTVVAIVAVLVAAAALYAISEFNRKPADVATLDAQVKVNAAELFSAYEANEQQANASYLTKVIAVTGTVGEVTEDQNQNKVVVLREADAMFGVQCTMKKDQTDAVNKIQPGQKVTIKGLCTGYLMDVVLTDGSFVE
jgi:hypothetical protein